MKKMLEKVNDNRMYFIGIALVLVIYFPILCLNSRMLAIIHDEFDGEVLSYILEARHLFGSNIPELLDGTGKVSLSPPAIGMVPFYMIFRPATAFFICYILIAFTAYTGMYFCVKKLLGNDLIGMITGFLFSLLPFYSVYGLSVMGQPILVYSFYVLFTDTDDPEPFFLIALFSLFSSLAVVGYADIIILFVIGIIGLIKRRPMKRYIKGFIELCGVYALTNFSLILSVFGFTKEFVSNRTEMLETSIPWKKSFSDMFWKGMYHAASNHERIVWVSLIVFAFALVMIRKMKTDDKRKVLQMGLLLLMTVLIAAFYAFWHCNRITMFRNAHGGLLNGFQIDRFYWLYPCIWFLIFAYALYFILLFFKKFNILKYSLVGVFALFNFLFLWDNSSIKVNSIALRNNKNYLSGYTSVDAFFQKDMFTDIKETIGRPQKDYRVISVGLYPSIALYNGFYCLDGYSSNYNIEYKHEFRDMIAGELDRSDTIRSYYDDWGNRCYAFSSELGLNYYVPKNSDQTISKLDYDYHLLKKADCEYILSSVEITGNNPLKLIKKFSSDSSYYDVYLYQIE